MSPLASIIAIIFQVVSLIIFLSCNLFSTPARLNLLEVSQIMTLLLKSLQTLPISHRVKGKTLIIVLPGLPTLLSLFLHLTSLQLHWPPCHSSNTKRTFPPQNFFFLTWLAFPPDISVPDFLFHSGLYLNITSEKLSLPPCI